MGKTVDLGVILSFDKKTRRVEARDKNGDLVKDFTVPCAVDKLKAAIRIIQYEAIVQDEE